MGDAEVYSRAPADGIGKALMIHAFGRTLEVA